MDQITTFRVEFRSNLGRKFSINDCNGPNMKEMFVIRKYAREITLTYSGGRAKNARNSKNLTEINAHMIWKNLNKLPDRF